MSAELSKKPYIIRAIYEWCADSSLTPYLGVKVDQHVRVPMEYVKNGEIVLSISLQATRNLTIGNELIQFSARFNGVSREISVPIYAVQSIFARENGQGFFFEPESPPANYVASASATTKPAALTVAPAVAPVVATTTPLLQAVPVGATPVEIAPEHAVVEEDHDDSTDPDKPKAPPRGNLRVIK